MRMVRRLVAVLVLGAALAALLASPGGASVPSPHCLSFTRLSPENEVRTAADTSDPVVDSRASGFAFVHIRGTTLQYVVVIFNPARETFFAGHIHVGAAGTNGPIVVPLFSGSTSQLVFTQSEQVQISAETATAICGNLSGYYVNYHTTLDPIGATRGQLR